ncbi:MAG: HAMP domain-containing protein, partial [Spirulinaceae cyanobacterium]
MTQGIDYSQAYGEAERAYLQGEFEAAATVIDRLASDYEEDAAVQLLRGHIYCYGLEDFAIAQQQYERVKEITDNQEYLNYAESGIADAIAGLEDEDNGEFAADSNGSGYAEMEGLVDYDSFEGFEDDAALTQFMGDGMMGAGDVASGTTNGTENGFENGLDHGVDDLDELADGDAFVEMFDGDGAADWQSEEESTQLMDSNSTAPFGGMDWSNSSDLDPAEIGESTFVIPPDSQAGGEEAMDFDPELAEADPAFGDDPFLGDEDFAAGFDLDDAALDAANAFPDKEHDDTLLMASGEQELEPDSAFGLSAAEDMDSTDIFEDSTAAIADADPDFADDNFPSDFGMEDATNFGAAGDDIEFDEFENSAFGTSDFDNGDFDNSALDNSAFGNGSGSFSEFNDTTIGPAAFAKPEFNDADMAAPADGEGGDESGFLNEFDVFNDDLDGMTDFDMGHSDLELTDATLDFAEGAPDETPSLGFAPSGTSLGDSSEIFGGDTTDAPPTNFTRTGVSERTVEPTVEAEDSRMAWFANYPLAKKQWVMAASAGVASALSAAFITFLSYSQAPAEKKEAVISHMFLWSAAVCLFSGGSSFGAIWFLGKETASQIKRSTDDLQAQFDAVSDGDFNAKATVYAEDDFGQLASGFNEMARVILTTTSEAQRRAEETEQQK